MLTLNSAPDLDTLIELRTEYIQEEQRLRSLITTLDAYSAKAMEQYAVFIFWLSPDLEKERFVDFMNLVQQLRMSDMLPLAHQKIAFISYIKSNKYSAAELSALFGITRKTAKQWLDTFDECNYTLLDVTEQQCIDMRTFVNTHISLHKGD